MFSNCKTIRAVVSPLYRQVIRMTRRTSTTGSPNGPSGVKGHDQIRVIFPCCACPGDDKPSTPTEYNTRKYGHCLPSNDVRPPFDSIPNLPTGIFRCTAGETLGSGADKCGCYQCAEYFSYQHMTYYDMHLILRAVRNPSSNTGRKP